MSVKIRGLHDSLSISILNPHHVEYELYLCRYVYDYIGGDHDKILKELLATFCTFAITTLWLGPCELVYLWSFFNCFGLNFELWVAKFFSLPPFSTMEVRNTEVNNYVENICLPVSSKHLCPFYLGCHG